MCRRKYLQRMVQRKKYSNFNSCEVYHCVNFPVPFLLHVLLQLMTQTYETTTESKLGNYFCYSIVLKVVYICHCQLLYRQFCNVRREIMELWLYSANFSFTCINIMYLHPQGVKKVFFKFKLYLFQVISMAWESFPMWQTKYTYHIIYQNNITI